MVEAIVNLLLVVLALGCLILWVSALVESDGECHEEDCTLCPWSGGCEYEKKREENV